MTNKEISEQIRKWMVQHGKTLSTAESCTSGRIAAILTSVSGASEYFQGGLAAYQDSIKMQFLGVKAETIAQHDVVSRQVVEEMVRGCVKMFNTDYAIASTGYTGAGCNGIPSGTVWLGWGNANEIHTICLTEDNGREANTANAASTAVRCFLEDL